MHLCATSSMHLYVCRVVQCARLRLLLFPVTTCFVLSFFHCHPGLSHIVFCVMVALFSHSFFVSSLCPNHPHSWIRLRLSLVLDHLFIAPEDGTPQCDRGMTLDQIAVIVVVSVFAIG